MFYSSYVLHKSDFTQLDDIPKYMQPDGIKQFDIQAFLTDILFKIQLKISCAGAVLDKIAKQNASAEPVLIFKPPARDEIEIKVSLLAGDQSSLITVRLSDTISNVKKKIKKTVSCDPEAKLHLKFGNKILRDNLTVFDYNIQIGSNVYIILEFLKKQNKIKKRQKLNFGINIKEKLYGR
ncbi:unnamed protein product [Mytilus coruscus]|uniref:Ubiquitin-like domain-containing protein n=1 Tax=Mytilus coruscus TaxID=42192 RepID=A0A6J8CTL8_MYTCO|nr:unnamed protein product [Mytilus coruscus]